MQFPVSNGIAISNNEFREWSLYLNNNRRRNARKKEMTSGREKEKTVGLWGGGLVKNLGGFGPYRAEFGTENAHFRSDGPGGEYGTY